MPDPALQTTAATSSCDAAVRSPSHAAVWSALVKARLSGLVLATTAVGFAVARPPEAEFPWARFGWTCLGTALAAASAAMLNQLWERHLDARMERTRARPLPQGHARPITVFLAGAAAAYGGFAVLAGLVNLLSATLAVANILVYVLLYTPLKTRTTFNTLVGAVTGAVPPMIGWAAAANDLSPGAWALFSILFVWQIPHFLALAWMYREDYARGGFAMLPSLDAHGRGTAQACVLSSLALVPAGLLATLTGVAGYAYTAAAVVLGLAMVGMSVRFLRLRSDAAARGLFLASLAYLPLLLGVMVADRGTVVPRAVPAGHGTALEYPPQQEPSP